MLNLGGILSVHVRVNASKRALCKACTRSMGMRRPYQVDCDKQVRSLLGRCMCAAGRCVSHGFALSVCCERAYSVLLVGCGVASEAPGERTCWHHCSADTGTLREHNTESTLSTRKALQVAAVWAERYTSST